MPTPATSLPDGPLLAYYGDDFTGSTDVMEVMTFNGLPTVLFLEPPNEERLAQYRSYRGIGIAGTARSESPKWMDAHLPGIFAQLDGIGAPILQYKICSTFDSAPEVGSIGRALELGLKTRASVWSPMVVAAPALRRFQAFGNLFATVDGVGYRLDRHPTMARHPITPMTEADLLRHLAGQTELPTDLVHLVDLKTGTGRRRIDAARNEGACAVLIDVVDEETLTEAGRIVWEMRGQGLFTASSSGLQYALAAYWRQEGLLGSLPPPTKLAPTERLMVVSGSCSPATEAQIAWSLENGFTGIRLNVLRVLDAATRQVEVDKVVAQSAAALSEGRSPVVYSARGPEDPAVFQLLERARACGSDSASAQAAIGDALGQVLASVLRRTSVKRAVVAGGDTAGRAAGALGIYALEAAAPVAPGSPLCFAAADDPENDGLEIALKGGQVGGPDYFARVRDGGCAY